MRLRRRAKSEHLRVRPVLANVLLVVVVGAPVVASAVGLMAAGRDVLGLSGGWELLVPLVLDAAAAYSAVLAFRDVLAGDSALVNRALVWGYAFLSAGVQVVHSHSAPMALFYAAASVSACLLWDRTLRGARREQLRARGAVAAPTPRFRAARWVLAPVETARAFRVGVVEGVADPAEAVAQVRALGAGQPPAPSAPVGELAGLSKAAAVRRAVGVVGRDPERVCRWLAARGVEVPRTYVHDVARRDRERVEQSGDDGERLRLAG